MTTSSPRRRCSPANLQSINSIYPNKRTSFIFIALHLTRQLAGTVLICNYTYGHLPGTGETISLVNTILPGESDPFLSWPFKLIFRDNIINLSEPGNTWTKMIDPKDNETQLASCTLYELWESKYMFPLPDPAQQTLQNMQLPIHSE